MVQEGGTDPVELDLAEMFAKKLAKRLTTKCKEPYEVLASPKGTRNLWYVRSPSILAIRERSMERGTVYVYSYDLLRFDYLFADDDIHDSEDIVNFLQDLKDRRNWDYLSKRVCPHVVAYLTWADMIAKQASEEKKAEVEHWFPSKEYPALKRSSFRAVINTKGMKDDQKIEAIAKHIPAVITAYDLASDQKSWEAFMQDFVKKAKFGTTKS